MQRNKSLRKIIHVVHLFTWNVLLRGLCFTKKVWLPLSLAAIFVYADASKLKQFANYPSKKNTNVLFVGNSLTYTNDLPQLVKQEAKRRNVFVTTDQLAFPDYALEDHWNDGKLQKKIETGDYAFVIVQQGPSSQQDGFTMLSNYGKKIVDLCHKHQVKPVFFMVWPARENYRMFDGVIKNYTHVAQQTGAILCPVGKIWKAHIDSTGDYSWYGPDGFHPSPEGSKKAASVIAETLFK